MKTTGYLLQATIISGWWMAMSTSDSFSTAFAYSGITNMAFNSFLLPDIIIVVILSILKAYSRFQNLEYIILGGVSFGTFYCINLTIVTGSGYLSTALMILASCYNLFLIFGAGVFRQSETANAYANGFKTFVQVICIWSITLIFFPYLIESSFERSLSICDGPLLSFGLILLIFSSTLGVSSAISIVKVGKGTPLPMDQANRLVTTGPYKYVRNPMAVAGIGQGLAISIILNSRPSLEDCYGSL